MKFINMPKWIKSMNMAIQHVQGCSYVLISHFIYTAQKKLLLTFQNSQMKERGETFFGECIWILEHDVHLLHIKQYMIHVYAH